MRPAFSHERLSLTEDGRVVLALRKPWPKAGGVSMLCFEPLAFLRRLAPLIPPPFAHLIRYFGLFAPNAKGRDLLPSAPVSWQGIRPEAFIRTMPLASPESLCDSKAHTTPSTQDKPELLTDALPSQATTSRPRRKTLPWAELLRRVFAIDVLVCPKCLGPMTVIAYLTDPNVLAKLLRHLGLPTEPPPLSPARYRGQLDFFEDPLEFEARERSDQSGASRPRPSSRAPPDEERAEWTVELDEPTSAEDCRRVSLESFTPRRKALP